MPILSRYLWIAPNAVLAVCLIGIFLGRRQRQLPFFVSYVAFALASFLTSIAANILYSKKQISLNTFQWTATAGTALELALELCVLYELANELILSRSSSARALRGVLRWTAALLLLLAATVSALFSQPGLQRVVKAFQTLDFSANLIIVGLLLSLLIFSRVLQISWRSLPSGIALGFGVSASAEIAGSSLLSLLKGKSGFFTMDLV